ncbi:hypothetical protein HWV62_26396 [Athelia sp. TMB]|nr:hypothetical protein HWV62_26396 [Athelia sp. TMB]
MEDIAQITDSTNSTINSTIKSLFALSSRLLASIREYDKKMDHDMLIALGGSVDFDDIHDRMAPPPTFAPLPGPWRFATSGYAVVLLAMNIVVPPRHPGVARFSRNLRRQSSSRLRRIYDSILPLDLSSIYCRLVLRLPSLYFLSKALILWTVILLQTSELFPSWPWISALGEWAGGMEMDSLTMIHFLGIRQQWAQQRLIPTTITSALTLIHFYTVIWISPTSYPLLNYLPCIFESGLLCVTLLALGLNVLTQILLEGTISRPLFGHHETLLPKWDEDFSIVLLRMGTASLEATSVAGLGNEVGLVSVPGLDTAKAHTVYGSLEMNRLGVAAITNAVEGTGRRRKAKEGFANEIRHVRAKSNSNDGDLWMDSAWLRELTRFGASLRSFLAGLWSVVWDRIRGRSRQHTHAEMTGHPHTALSRGRTPAVDTPDAYERFLRGEVVSDDEDDYEPMQRSRANSVSDTSATSDSEEEDNAAETVDLYADLSSASASASNSAPVMLAHMTDTSPSPLTRRRYSRLVGDASSAVQGALDDWTRVLDGRRSFSERERDREESRRSCVICTAEPRQIICWPCRILEDIYSLEYQGD